MYIWSNGCATTLGDFCLDRRMAVHGWPAELRATIQFASWWPPQDANLEPPGVRVFSTGVGFLWTIESLRENPGTNAAPVPANPDRRIRARRSATQLHGLATRPPQHGTRPRPRPVTRPRRREIAPLAAADRAAAARDREHAARERRAAATRLENAYRDDVTGVLSRGAGRDQLRQALARAHRSGEPLVVAFLDVDHLKRINDERGHAYGDRLLQEVGLALRQGLRSYDVLARVRR